VYFALRRPDLRDEFTEYLRDKLDAVAKLEARG
jgi:hypothetical protein